MLSRRDLWKCALAGAADAGRNILPGTARLDAAQRGAPPADLLLANGTFVDGRGVVGSALTIRTGGRRRRGAGSRALRRGQSTWAAAPSSLVSSTRTCTTREPASIPATKRGASNVRSRSRSCRRRSRRARRRSRRAPSSHASVAGTTRSLPRIDGRRSPTWTRPRRSTASTFPAPAAARVRSRTASAARSSPREGDGR